MFNIKSILGILALACCGLHTASATPLLITFEGLADGTSVGSTYSSAGLTFTNATVLTAGISLNEFDFPPHSGTNVATDDGGPLTISFASPVDSFSGYFTYAEALSLVAFDLSNQQVAFAASLFSANYTSSGNPTNELIQLTFAGGFDSLTITGDPGGGSFVVDDITYQAGGAPPPPPPPATTPEPAGVWLLGTGFVALFGLRRSSLFGS